MAISVKPFCRYEHGDMIQINEGLDHSPKWGYMSASHETIIFTGLLFVCQKCGYTELFDDDVDTTVARHKGSP